jgi:hypothetical protein
VRTAHITVLRGDDSASLRQLVPAWTDLAASAFEPNVFYEPFMLLPALEEFGPGRETKVLLVFSDAGSNGTAQHRQLCGLFPMERVGPSLWSLWRYPHCYLCVPLVRAGFAHRCFEALFQWLATEGRSTMLLACPSISEEGPFYQSFVAYLKERETTPFVWRRTARPILRPVSDSALYLDRVLSGKKRRKLRNQERHLAEMGLLEYVALNQGGDIDRWLDGFLRLEASGWKGRDGTALQCSDSGRRFFRTALCEAFSQGRLMMLALRLNGRDIAQLCNFLCRDGSFAFKVAFDQEYARYSPGVLLELENIRQVHQPPQTISWMDSCTFSGQSPVQYLWQDHRTIQTVLVPTANWPGRWMSRLMPLLKVVAPRNLRSEGARIPEQP